MIFAFDSEGIQVSVTYTKSPSLILLFNQQCRRRKSTLVVLDDYFSQHVFHLEFNFIFHLW
jgi:hypothetical protein